MFDCSTIIIDELSSNLWFSSEYNANNAWLYNANNGNLNNNNKMNSNGVCGGLAFDYNGNRLSEFVSFYLYSANQEKLEKFIAFYASYLDDYRRTRKHKRGKDSQLVFEFHLQEFLIPLCWSIFNSEYVPKQSNYFVLPLPSIREVISAWFGDRIPQTRLVANVMPLLEAHFFCPNSYSCRVGKGGLRAVLQLLEDIRAETKLYTLEAWIFKFDIKSFFTSVDVLLFFPIFVDFVKEHMPDSDLRNELLYLARIIYLGYPQERCTMKGNLTLRKFVPEEKSLLGKTENIGLPVGNITNQMFCLMVTTFILRLLAAFGIKSILYTDDDCGITLDKRSFLRFFVWFKNEVYTRYHLRIHPKKFHLQYYKKSVNLLGLKIKYGQLLLPGDRLVHNFKWKITCAIEKANRYSNYAFRTKESFVCTMCSYLGLLKWTASYNLRKAQMHRLIDSPWGKILEFDSVDYYKVSIKKSYTLLSAYIRKNKMRKKLLKQYEYELN